MNAMVLKQLGSLADNLSPLEMTQMPVPAPGEQDLLIRVSVCGVCHTDLDEAEGRVVPPRMPVIPGHQVVGRVCQVGTAVSSFALGDRVGVAWIFTACGQCEFCRSGRENLCPFFKATGRDANGGYAEYMTVPADFAFRLPDALTDENIAPLLCAGAIGYRSLQLSRLTDGQSLGLAGFGASAHLVLQLVRSQYPQTAIFVFARDETERSFARQLGAVWTGDFEQNPPQLLDAIIDTTPAWKPIVNAQRHLKPGGRLIINAIRKEDTDKNYLLNLSYPEELWMEKEIKSVANITRRDVQEFLAIAARIPLRPEVETYPLAEANRALQEIKQGGNRGAKVLIVMPADSLHPNRQ